MSFYIGNLPLHIEHKIDEITGYTDHTVSYSQWRENEQSLLAEYGITCVECVTDGFRTGGYVAESEAAYTFFLLRFG